MRISHLLFISNFLTKLFTLTSSSLVIRVLDVREVSYPASSSSDSSDDLEIFNHPPEAHRQNRGRGSRAAARASSASRARARRGSSEAVRASTTASTGSTASRAGGVSIPNDARQSSGMLSSTAAAASSSSWT